jgi:transketolase
MELKSTRDAYGDALLELVEDTNVVVLDADLSVSTQTNKFAKRCPERFFNVVIPNMRVIVPVDAVETEKAIIEEVSNPGPAYIRLNRSKTPIIFDNNYEFTLGKAVKLREGDDLTIIATGTMVHEALEAAKMLTNENISTSVLNIHTVKPIDRESIIKEARRTGAIVTVEEHSIYGGLGSAIAELVVENYPVPMRIMGVKDKFGESGEYRELLKKHGLTAMNIFNYTKELLEKKR